MDAIEKAELPELRGIRIDVDFKDELKVIAKAHRRSLASEIRFALEMYVKDYREVDRG